MTTRMRSLGTRSFYIDFARDATVGVRSEDRRYVAAHLVEVLAGGAPLREFDARLVPPGGEDVPARLRVELVRDREGRQGWFLVEAWATT